MSAYERPNYQIIKHEKKFELRKYDSFSIVKYKSNDDFQRNEGFQTLFNYISKNNSKNTKINMTVPVIEQENKTKKTMAFVLPKAHTEDTPKPLNDHLEIETLDGGYYAVISYRGSWSTKHRNQQINLLKAWLLKNNLQLISDFITAYYNPPFIPSFLRHNEIWVKVKIEA
jgi:effector-binding domain-containing protein